MSDPAVYVAYRVSAHPDPHVASQRLRCAVCREQVWVDPKSYVPLKALEGSLRVLCIDCAARLEGAA